MTQIMVAAANPKLHQGEVWQRRVTVARRSHTAPVSLWQRDRMRPNKSWHIERVRQLAELRGGQDPIKPENVSGMPNRPESAWSHTEALRR